MDRANSFRAAMLILSANRSLGAINRGFTGWQAMRRGLHRHGIDGSESPARTGEQGDGENRDKQ